MENWKYHTFYLVPKEKHQQCVDDRGYTLAHLQVSSVAVTSLYDHDCLLSTLNEENLKYFINSLPGIM